MKDKQSSEILVHKGDPPNEGSKRTASGSGTAAPQEPCGPPRGPFLSEDTVGGPCAEKTSGAINGLGPAAVLQLTGEPGPPQGARDSWTSAANKGHPTQPFLEGGSARELDCMQLASGETQVIGNGGSVAPSTAGLAAWEVPAQVLQQEPLTRRVARGLGGLLGSHKHVWSSRAGAPHAAGGQWPAGC